MGFNKFEKIANSKKAKRLYNYSKLVNKIDIKNLRNIEKYDFLSQQLYGVNGWYNNLKKDKNGMIDWKNIEDTILDGFNIVYKSFEKISQKVSALDDVYISKLKFLAKNDYGYGGSF